MPKKYREKDLRELQAVELEMLKTFVEICERHHIDYFVSFGTAIGAVRHGGFIPWDDDIDIGMMRSEYEKLRSVPREEWGEEYFIADARDDCVFHRTLFPRMYKRGTAHETMLYWKYLKPKSVERYPIYMDLFLFDNFCSLTQRPVLRWIADLYKRLILYSKCRFAIYPDDSFSRKITSTIKNVLHDCLKLRRDSSRRLYSHYDRIMRINQNGKYVTCFEVVESREVPALTFLYDDCFPTQFISFEGVQVRIQKNYHHALSNLFGNYMALPPEGKRYNPLPRVIDFGDGRGNVLEEQWSNEATI